MPEPDSATRRALGLARPAPIQRQNARCARRTSPAPRRVGSQHGLPSLQGLQVLELLQLLRLLLLPLPLMPALAPAAARRVVEAPVPRLAAPRRPVLPLLPSPSRPVGHRRGDQDGSHTAQTPPRPLRISLSLPGPGGAPRPSAAFLRQQGLPRCGAASVRRWCRGVRGPAQHALLKGSRSAVLPEQLPERRVCPPLLINSIVVFCYRDTAGLW